MEGVEMEENFQALNSASHESQDIGSHLLSLYNNSSREDHQRLCAAIGAISQELQDHSLPLTPTSYFAATISSLHRMLSSPDQFSPADPIIASLLTFLSLILSSISTAVLRSKGHSILDAVRKVIGFRSEESSSSVAATKAGLKCISHLMVVGEKNRWESVGIAYRLLLEFITDRRPKVRKQFYSCLCEVLQSFQGSSLLAPASEGITQVFERFLLLAGGVDSAGPSAGEGPKGAMEVLYILGALKDCLPFMSMKFTTTILKHFKTLLELQQPIVTRHLVNVLYVLCSSQSSDFSPEVLLDLLCALASSLSVREKSADGMTFTARLLHVGMQKVYAVNRQICVVKLPLVFNTLGEILACEHGEAIFASSEALRGLVHACIDENLIKQGVDSVKMNPEGDTRRSGPTIMEKICSTLESFLGYQYNAVWDVVFQVLSAMFDKLGESSSFLMRGIVNTLGDMEKLPYEDFTYRKQLHECIGSAVGAMGPEIFLRLLPLNLDAEDVSEANVWLFPILKQYTVGARLSFFTESILDLISLVRQKSQMLEKRGQIFSSRSMEALVYSLWSLLPAFCNYPIDTAVSFSGLTKAICNAFREEPEVHGILCSSLQILIQQNKKMLAENDYTSNTEVSILEKRARDYYTRQVVADNLNAIKASSPEFFSVLSGIFLKSSKSSGGLLQSTIEEFASVADKKVVKRFFTTTMQKLLKATQEAVQAEQPRKSNSMQIDDSASDSSPSLARAQLLDLAVSLLPGLDVKEVDLLFIAIKPALQDGEGLVQKKAYKILSIILRECEEFLSSKLDVLLELMIEVLPSCHFSAKRHRLDSLYFLIVHVSKDTSAQRKRGIIGSFLTEIILALKEANKKTRNRAYDLLVQIGHACGDEEHGGKKENLQQFFNMVAGGLAGETPHMISAAVKGLARLAYEFSELVASAYNVLPLAFLLLQRKNKEIIKANLGLVKVLVAKSQAEGLQTHLKSMVEGLLKWQDDTKKHFKAKIKFLLEMLVKKCGLEAVKAVMPEEHMKLLTNIRKTKERKERRIAKSEAETRSLHSIATTSRHSKWNHTNIFSDFGDKDTDNSDTEHMDETTVSGRSKISSRFNSKAASSRSIWKRRATKSLPEDLSDEMEDDPLDLLDLHKTRMALHSSDHLKRKPESNDEPEIAPDGRLVIHEDGKPKKREKSVSSDFETDTRSRAGNSMSMKTSSTKAQKRQKTDSGWAYTGSEYTSKKTGGDVKRKGKLEREKTVSSDFETDTRSRAGSSVSMKTYSTKAQKRQKTDSGWAYTGSEYTSKKAGGDVKRKGKLEPYAYWPLDRKMLSRRGKQKVAAQKGMASVMKLTKRLEGKSAAVVFSMKRLKFKRKQKRVSRKTR